MQVRKKIIGILILTGVITVLIFVFEQFGNRFDGVVQRNSYGQGKKTETYQFTIGGKKETIQLEVEEQEYTKEEIREIFTLLMEQLDEIVLGENKSWDRVEKNLNLITQVEQYPIQIHWEFSSYDVISLDGIIQEEHLQEEGTLLELKGILSYGEEKATYIRNARVYPPSGEGKEKLRYQVQKKLTQLEKDTRKEERFTLPRELSGETIHWSKENEGRWKYVLIVGIAMVFFVIYQEKEKNKQNEKQRRDELTREYPGLISKFTMLLNAGATVKVAWEKIVQNQNKRGVLAQEMQTTLHEIQSGISEVISYEQFGKRCGIPVYLKFGTLLSQNLRKGNRGLSDKLQVEAIEAFEERKSLARRRGEEAGAKLMMPMLGMLIVVLVMIMVPAFISMQI